LPFAKIVRLTLVRSNWQLRKLKLALKVLFPYKPPVTDDDFYHPVIFIKNDSI